MKRRMLWWGLLWAAGAGLMLGLIWSAAFPVKRIWLSLSLGCLAGTLGGVIVWYWGVRRWQGVQHRHPGRRPLNEPGHIWPWQLSQIFISHTLHNVAALTLVDPDAARQTIESLGELLRLVVDMYRQPFTLLTQEVKCAEIFLTIEQARLGRRLQIVKDVSADCLEFRVPSLFLLPLIENAIQYGIETSDQPSYVILSARKELGHLVIEISETASRQSDQDAVQQMMQDNRMKQLHRQLQNLYHQEQPIESTALAPAGTRLSIMLPLQ